MLSAVAAIQIPANYPAMNTNPRDHLSFCHIVGLLCSFPENNRTEFSLSGSSTTQTGLTASLEKPLVNDEVSGVPTTMLEDRDPDLIYQPCMLEFNKRL